MAKFKPGVSGNPNGRPKKGTTLADILAEKLDKDVFIQKLIDLAQNDGNMTAIKEILERIDGKVKEKVDHTIDIGNILDELKEAYDDAKSS